MARQSGAACMRKRRGPLHWWNRDTSGRQVRRRGASALCVIHCELILVMPPTTHQAATARARFYEAVSKASFKSLTSLIAVLREGGKSPDPPVRFIAVGASGSLSLCLLLLIVMLVHVVAHATNT